MGRMNRKNLSALLTVSPVTIWRWEREGLPVAHRGGKGRENLYELTDVLAWLKATGFGGARRMDRQQVPLTQLEQRVTEERAAVDADLKARLPAYLAKMLAEIALAWCALAVSRSKLPAAQAIELYENLICCALSWLELEIEEGAEMPFLGVLGALAEPDDKRRHQLVTEIEAHALEMVKEDT